MNLRGNRLKIKEASPKAIDKSVQALVTMVKQGLPTTSVPDDNSDHLNSEK